MENKYQLLANMWKNQADESNNEQEQAWLYACAADLKSLTEQQSNKTAHPGRQEDNMIYLKVISLIAALCFTFLVVDDSISGHRIDWWITIIMIAGWAVFFFSMGWLSPRQTD